MGLTLDHGIQEFSDLGVRSPDGRISLGLMWPKLVALAFNWRSLSQPTLVGARAGAWAGHGSITVSGAGAWYPAMVLPGYPYLTTMAMPPRVHHPPCSTLSGCYSVCRTGKRVLWALNEVQSELEQTHIDI